MINKYPYTDFNEYNMDWIIKTVKDLTVEWAGTKTEWSDVKTEWENYKNYIDNYFAQLDLSQEVSDKIDQMAAAGYFSDLFNTLFRTDIMTQAGQITSDWIAANILQETGYVLDASLTIENAAADAKAAGDRLDALYDSYYTGSHTASGNIWVAYTILAGHTYTFRKSSGGTTAVVFHTTDAIGSYNYIDTVNGGSPVTVQNRDYTFTATASTNAIIVYANGAADWEIFDSIDETILNDRGRRLAYEIVNKTESIQNLPISLNNGNIYSDLKYVWEKGGLLQNNGGLWQDGTFCARTMIYYEAPADMTVIINKISANNVPGIWLYDDQKAYIGYYNVVGTTRTIDIPKGYFYKLMITGDSTNPVDLEGIDSYIEVLYVNKNTMKLPDYYDTYMASKLSEIKQASAYISGVTFPFITDVHLQYNALNSGKMIKYIDDKTNAVPFVIFGGDVPMAIDTAANVMKYADQWNEYMDTWGKHKTIQVHGNHDYMCALDPGMQNLWFAPLTDVFEYVQQNAYFMVDRPVGALYGAIDIPDQKVKIIIADNYDSTYDFANDTWTGGAGMTDDQLKWIAQTVLDSAGYHVLFVSHVPTLSSMSVPAEAAALQPFDDLIRAAKNKTYYTVDSVVYNFTAWTGDVIAELAGHMHLDASAVDGNVLYIGTTCDSYSDSDPYVTRSQGTVSEQAFDIVCIDTFNKKIELVRMGGGSNRSFTY